MLENVAALAHRRCFFHAVPLAPRRRRHAVARRAPASTVCEADALQLALPDERLLMRRSGASVAWRSRSEGR
eukprot:scaffold99616_cov37-Phaeocystis_antarctica.AAC.1